MDISENEEVGFMIDLKYEKQTDKSGMPEPEVPQALSIFDRSVNPIPTRGGRFDYYEIKNTNIQTENKDSVSIRHTRALLRDIKSISGPPRSPYQISA